MNVQKFKQLDRTLADFKDLIDLGHFYGEESQSYALKTYDIRDLTSSYDYKMYKFERALSIEKIRLKDHHIAQNNHKVRDSLL